MNHHESTPTRQVSSHTNDAVDASVITYLITMVLRVMYDILKYKH